MLTAWCALWLPCLILSGFVGMGIADGGKSLGGEFVVWVFALCYPALFGVAFYYRRRKPNLVWLPGLSFVFAFVAISFLS